MRAAGETISTLFLLDPTPPTKLISEHDATLINGKGETGLKRRLSRLPGDLHNLTFAGVGDPNVWQQLDRVVCLFVDDNGAATTGNPSPFASEPLLLREGVIVTDFTAESCRS